MAHKRQKRRTHAAPPVSDDIPRSMVIKMGDSKRPATKALGALVRDFRTMMQPHTAAKLKERKANRLKDFLVMAGPLGVTHFFLFTQSRTGHTTLRIARTPRGPTLYFDVEQYALARDIQKTQKRPHSLTNELRHPPLLIMNGFSAERTSDKNALLTSMLRGVVPPLQIQATQLSSLTRVLLFEKDPDTDKIELRHYAITVSDVSASRAVRRLKDAAKGRRELPRLGSAEDVADYIADPGFSESEPEYDVVDAPTPSQLKASAAARAGAVSAKTRKAIRLVEVGPRLTLSLKKVEEGLCTGRTLWHFDQSRSPSQIKLQEAQHRAKDFARAERRRVQEENVKRKRDEAAQKTTRSQRGREKALKLANGEKAHHDDGASEAESAEERDPTDMNDYELEAELAAAEASEESSS